jgi:DNA (cytosine-5)-methyltransferase 1
MDSPLTFYEFFAGGGMARVGLGQGWTPLFANDFDPLKARTYAANFGSDHLKVADIWNLTPADLPGRADLAWASSPCQDLSLAGRRKGLAGARSSAFWGFWRLMQGLEAEERAPKCIVIENVTGLLTSHGGADFTALCQAMADLGYDVGAVELDAERFTPQSRPRLFIIAERRADRPRLGQWTRTNAQPKGPGPTLPFHTRRIFAAYERLPLPLRATWIWWWMRAPPKRNATLSSVLEPDDQVEWWSDAERDRLLDALSPPQRERVRALQASGERHVGAVYRRMRVEGGVAVQRAEARFDGLAGCLRTPGGGSSRQFLLVVEGDDLRARQLTAREGARLMGLADSYRLPQGPTAAFHVIGDGVAPPAVRHLAVQLLEPLLRRQPGPAWTEGGWAGS